MSPSEDTPIRFAKRMRRFIGVTRKWLRYEFFHNLRTARLWEEALGELLAVIGEWRIRWPDWMEESDYAVWQAVRFLVESAAHELRAVLDKSPRITGPAEWLPHEDVVKATYRAAEHLR
jgi:hypothetical protein